MKSVIQTITAADPRYPNRLRILPDMPQTLYVVGSLPDDDLPSVAIVGARLCDQYGKKTAQDFGRILAANGVQIISGMAIGIDSLSQKAALAGGGTSFAVLGSGADVCYPPGNQTLYDKLIVSGGIISEQPPGTPPLRHNFPLRNRLISALADIVLVVEAKAKSGSLITVDYALEQGKTVFAVPGRVGDALSDGCNHLIAQGAGIACSPDAILEELVRLRCHAPLSEATREELEGLRQDPEEERIRKEKRVLTNSTLSDQAKQIYQSLDWSEELSSDQLQLMTELPIEEVSSALTELLLFGYAFMPQLNHYLRL